MSKQEIIEILKEVKNEIRQRYKSEIKGVFGSFVRDAQKEDSDIDVLVEFEEGADLFDYVGLSLFLEEQFNSKVDVVPTDSLREEIKPYVLKEAIYL